MRVKSIFALFLRDSLLKLKEKTMKAIPDSVREELAALAGKTDEDIDLSDIPATTHEDWVGAVRGKFYRPVKQQLTVRIDADVLAWLKQGGDKGYQKRLNAILRDAMLSAGRGSS